MLYPIELRERVLRAYDKGVGNLKEVAELFDVGHTTISRWLKLRRETGSVNPRPHGGGRPSKLGAKEQEVLLELVDEKPDDPLREFARKLEEKAGVKLHQSNIAKNLHKLGKHYKKNR